MPRRFVEGTRLLIVDDDDALRVNARRMLEMCGATVVCAENGQLAKVAILEQREPFHAVLTDMEMPVMDGIELAARIKVIAPNTPVMMWTGRPNNAEGHEADLLLTKPVAFAELIESFAILIPDRLIGSTPAMAQA